MQPFRKALIVFMRYPEPGEVKTRLASGIGWEEAARVYEKLIRRTLGVVADFKRLDPDVEVFVSFTPEEKRIQIQEAFFGPWQFVPQEGAHLGERMAGAILNARSRGHDQVLLVGTDLADIEPSDFREAFDALDRGYAVLGPAADGGFYLIGLNRPCPSPFRSETWGTSDVFERTKRKLQESGFQVHSLSERKDIDRPEDLEALNRDRSFSDRISVIIPTLSSLDQLRQRAILDRLEPQLWQGDEIIVVQGMDEVAGGPRQIGPRARWITSPKGRGLQLNHGAAEARGTLFFFLHDDGLPPVHFGYLIRKIAQSPQVSLGCFRLAFRPSTPLLDAIAGWANIRTQYFGLPYGDQGLFCRREVFDKVKGFHRPFLMEDVDFVNRCRRWGSLSVCPEAIHTSPARYLERGILRASMQNHMTMFLYHLGVDDRTLYSFYYKTRLERLDQQPTEDRHTQVPPRGRAGRRQ